MFNPEKKNVYKGKTETCQKMKVLDDPEIKRMYSRYNSV